MTLPSPAQPAPATPPAPAHDARRTARIGVLCGAAAYAWWGLIPIYFKLLKEVSPLQILAHRVLWSVIFLVVLVSLQREWPAVRQAVRNRKVPRTLALATVLLAINWLTFIYAVTTNRVVQASLGYFINPFVLVTLGIVVLRERLRPAQLISILIAAAGVANQIIAVREVPWIALSLAFSFGFYGLLRKTVAAGPLVGLALETLMLLPLALILLCIDLFSAHAFTYHARSYALLPLAGAITAIPLLLFAKGARSLRLSTMGFLQYIGPTGQLLLAVFAWHEPFTRRHAYTFALIWLALIVYSIDSFLAMRRAAKPLPPPTPDDL